MAVYWLGQDGNIWFRGNDGVQNMGKPSSQGFTQAPFRQGMSDKGFSAERGSAEARLISDPNPGGGSTGNNPFSGGGGGGGGSSANVLNQGAVDATQQAINSLGTSRSVGLKNIMDSYSSLMGKYDRDRSRNQADYNEQDVTNNQNLLKNKQNALLAGAQGRRGLRGTLASIGALSGDGGKLADRAVTNTVNQDVGEAADSYASNAQTLGRAWKNFEDEDFDRRSEAKTAKRNQKTDLERSLAEKRQGFYSKMADLYGQADNTGESNKWLSRVGGLNEVIARNQGVAATPFTERKAAFTPGTLESYLAGAGDMTARVSEGGMGGQGSNPTVIAGRGLNRRREDERY